MDIHVAHRDRRDTWTVHRSSMGDLVLELGHDVKVVMGRGEACMLRDQLTEALRPPER